MRSGRVPSHTRAPERIERKNETAPGDISEGRYFLVAGAGFEPTTSGL
jgi:hypothetical protein